MLRQRHIRPLTLWMAIVAVLMAALAPAVAHALNGAAARALAEVCSSSPTGTWRATAALDDPAPAAPISHVMTHCPYCALHMDSLVPPQPGALLHLPLQLGDGVPPLFLAAPRTLFVWARAQPRAPPLAC